MRGTGGGRELRTVHGEGTKVLPEASAPAASPLPAFPRAPGLRARSTLVLGIPTALLALLSDLPMLVNLVSAGTLAVFAMVRGPNAHGEERCLLCHAAPCGRWCVRLCCANHLSAVDAP